MKVKGVFVPAMVPLDDCGKINELFEAEKDFLSGF